jgi:hypothetical protein
MIESTLSTVLEGLRSTTDAVGYASPSAEVVAVAAFRGEAGVAVATTFRIDPVGEETLAPPEADDTAVPRPPPGDSGAVAPACSMSV